MTTNPSNIERFTETLEMLLNAKVTAKSLTLPEGVTVDNIVAKVGEKIASDKVVADALTGRNVNSAALKFTDFVSDAAKKSGFGVGDIDELAAVASAGLETKNIVKLAESHPIGSTARKELMDKVDKMVDPVKDMAKSYDKIGGGFGNGAIRYGTAAVGAYLVYNRIKAIFKKKEVVNEQTGEVEQKNPSFWSRLGNLLLATGIGVVAYKVGYQGKTFGQVGEDVSNTWAKYVTNRGKTQSLGVLGGSI